MAVGARPLALMVMGLALLPLPASAQDGRTTGPRSVVDGVYTSAQLERGENMFLDVCANCHSTSQFKGADFEMAWLGRTVRDLFRLISSTMPQDNPGRLAPQEYADVIAYILKLNGYPAGKAVLGTDEDVLRRIRIDKPAGG